MKILLKRPKWTMNIFNPNSIHSSKRVENASTHPSKLQINSKTTYPSKTTLFFNAQFFDSLKTLLAQSISAITRNCACAYKYHLIKEIIG